MKKNVLALSIATMIGGLGFSGAAMAAAGDITVNESGAGVIQIVPYFTAQDGNATVLHVVNTDAENGKAVKIRFRGASNSDDLLDFQVFLSPNDVWTGMAAANADGVLQLYTSDNSCTLPAFVRTDGGTVAQLDRLTHPLWDTAAKKAAQTREGYIEILEMASIPPKSRKSGSSVGAKDETNPLYTAVKHVKGTDKKMAAPCTPAAFDFLDAIADGGVAEAAGTAGTDLQRLALPTGNLAASWYILNVAKSTTFSGSATALQVDTIVNPVYAPQMSGTVSKLASADPLFGGNKNGAGATSVEYIKKQSFDVPDLSTPLATAYTGTAATDLASAQTQAAKLTAAITRKTLSNQFYQDAVLNAATDWVISMPTRRYTVAANYEAAKVTPFVKKDYVVLNDVADVANATLFADFDKLTVNAAGQICGEATGGQTLYDREEDSVKNGHVVSPGIAKVLNLCGEVHVATFGAASPLGASVAQSSFKTDFGAGWGTVSFGTTAPTSVPALGAAFTAASNPSAAAGMVGNYGITWPHTYTK